MGYTTEFQGEINVEPALSPEEISFLQKFCDTRRMNRTNGPYYVEGDTTGMGNDKDVIDNNSPPAGQPGLWCHWVPTEDGKAIHWDGGEKFYCSEEWMAYLIEYFFGDKPKAAAELPFLKGHVLNGQIKAQGEEIDDRWMLIVKDNKVEVKNLI